MMDPFGIEKVINNAVDGMRDHLMHDLEIMVWRMTATNALRVLGTVDPDNAAKYQAAIEAIR